MKSEEMRLNEIRQEIDELDAHIRDLLMKRLDYAEQIVQTKIDAGTRKIYRADREERIIENMSEGIPPERITPIMAFVRKMIEISRMHQYGILYEQTEDLFEPLLEDVEIPENPTTVKFEMIRPNIPGEVAVICGLISDYRYNVIEIKQMDTSIDNEAARLWLTVDGSIYEKNMQKMLIQLSQESEDFTILRVG